MQAAIDRIIAGPEKKRNLLNADEKRRVAYHESGHAMVAVSVPTGEIGPLADEIDAELRARWPRSRVVFASKAFPATAVQRVMVEEGLGLDVAGAPTVDVPATGGPLAGRVSASHRRFSSYQRSEFCGFSTQWFSSGNHTSRAGTPSDFSVL